MSPKPGIQQLPPAVLVAVGAAAGAGARWALASVIDNSAGLLVVNVAGSFLIGWLAGRSPAISRSFWLLAATGFCGGLTSFSSFALDVARNLDNSQPGTALQIAAATVALAIPAAVVGFRLAAASATENGPA